MIENIFLQNLGKLLKMLTTKPTVQTPIQRIFFLEFNLKTYCSTFYDLK